MIESIHTHTETAHPSTTNHNTGIQWNHGNPEALNVIGRVREIKEKEGSEV